jgi:hypothetical protein
MTALFNLVSFERSGGLASRFFTICMDEAFAEICNSSISQAIDSAEVLYSSEK